MALRSACSRLLSASSTMQATTLRHFSVPTVYDKMVQFTIMDQEGHRHTLRGLEGQKLINILVDNMHQLDLEDSICKNPDRANEYEAHVKVPQELVGVVPAPSTIQAKDLFESWADKIEANSRPASTVVLSKDMNGMLFAVADVHPFRSL